MNNTGFTLPPKLYDFLKWIALIVLPAVAALSITVGPLIHWGGAVTTAAVITAVDTFLGLLLGKGSSNFAQSFGDLIVQQDIDGTPTGMKLVGHQESPVFVDGGRVYLTVKREQVVNSNPSPLRDLP